jgi:hypothetical protein
MSQLQELQAHAERIRASGVLGRSELMNRLFDFLVECSLTDKAPKEIELAMDVFGKDARFEVTQDAMVRVYVHKLRRKLDEYYAGPGCNETWRISVPRGEYRLQFVESQNQSAPPDTDADTDIEIASDSAPAFIAPNSLPRTRWITVALAATALLAINALVWLGLARGGFLHNDELTDVRQSNLWRDIAATEQPVTIVLGDYYIFGELDTPSDNTPESVRRLVREFNINSRNDLDHWLKANPAVADRYMDLALRYLPVSSAFALNNVAPLLQPGSHGSRRVQIVLASDLTPSMIRSSHVIYIGLLSGMGILRDIVFAGSQFKIGDTYDELVDQQNGTIYVSQSSIAIHDATRYRDYGYFSTFAGPDGKRIVILSGTRDVALMHTAEAVSRMSSLRAVIKHADNSDNFEALYAVDAIDHMSLDGQLLLTNSLDTKRIWSGVAVAAVTASSAL